MVSIRARVDDVLGGREDWRAELARSLADHLDGEANASMARELRSVMEAVEADVPVVGGTPLDELARRRQAQG